MGDEVEDLSSEVPQDYFNMHLTVLKLIGINILPIGNPILRALYNVYSFIFVWITYIIFLGVEFQALFDNKDDIEVVAFILGYWIVHFMGINSVVVDSNWRNVVLREGREL